MLMHSIGACGRQSLLNFMEKAKGSPDGGVSGFGFLLPFTPCCSPQLLGILEFNIALKVKGQCPATVRTQRAKRTTQLRLKIHRLIRNPIFSTPRSLP